MTPYESFKYKKEHSISHTAEIMLDFIREFNEPTVMKMVSEAIQQGIGSYNHIHQALMWLKLKGFISIMRDNRNKRQKICYLNMKGITYLQEYYESDYKKVYCKD